MTDHPSTRDLKREERAELEAAADAFAWGQRFALAANLIKESGVYFDRDDDGRFPHPYLIVTTPSGGWIRVWDAASASPGEGPMFAYEVHSREDVRIAGGRSFATAVDLAQVVSNDHGIHLDVFDCTSCYGHGILWDKPDDEGVQPWADNVRACQTCNRFVGDVEAAHALARILCAQGQVHPDPSDPTWRVCVTTLWDHDGNLIRDDGMGNVPVKIRGDFPEACMDAQLDLDNDARLCVEYVKIPDPMHVPRTTRYRDVEDLEREARASGLFIALCKIGVEYVAALDPNDAERNLSNDIWCMADALKDNVRDHFGLDA